MKNIIAVLTLAVICSTATAQTRFKVFGETKTTNAHCLYVSDRKKTNEKCFTFHSVNEALKYINGKGNATIYIEPSVYWIDNPDDNAIRHPKEGESVPFGMEVNMSDVHLIGLSDSAEDVVLACNRGQTQGAIGNFTMFHIIGNNISTENITFGNYCNVDLVYPRNAKLNRKKRAEAVVQAQLIICDGGNFWQKTAVSYPV